MLLLNGQKEEKEEEEEEDSCDTAAEKYMYSHGIFIPSNLDSSLIPSIMIFNIALTHHLYAEQCHDRSKSLQKAYRLYELAYESQRCKEEEQTSPNILFMLASSIVS